MTGWPSLFNFDVGFSVEIRLILSWNQLFISAKSHLVSAEIYFDFAWRFPSWRRYRFFLWNGRPATWHIFSMNYSFVVCLFLAKNLQYAWRVKGAFWSDDTVCSDPYCRRYAMRFSKYSCVGFLALATCKMCATVVTLEENAMRRWYACFVNAVSTVGFSLYIRVWEFECSLKNVPIS